MAKPFPAKIASKCPACSSPITKGQMIQKWGERYAHQPCVAAASATARINAGETFRSGGSASAWQRKPKRNQSKYS